MNSSTENLSTRLLHNDLLSIVKPFVMDALQWCIDDDEQHLYCDFNENNWAKKKACTHSVCMQSLVKHSKTIPICEVQTLLMLGGMFLLFVRLAMHHHPHHQHNKLHIRTSSFNKATINFYHRVHIFVTNRNRIALSVQFSLVWLSVESVLAMTHIKLAMAATAMGLKKTDCIVKIEFVMLCT